LSATASEACVCDVPFINDKRFIDLRSYGDAEMGSFRVVVLNPLTDIQGNVASANILVTAQFVDGKVLLPHHFNPQSKVEAVAKSKDGIISGTIEATTSIPSVLGNIPGLKPYTNVFNTIAKPAASLARMVGLSKPNSVASTTVVKPYIYSGINHGKGLDYTEKLAMDPANQISTAPDVGGISEDEMLLSHIVGTPMLDGVFTVTDTPLAIEIMSTHRKSTEFTFVDFIGNLFRYASGSYKVKVYITASQMHAVRGVFYLSDGSTADWQNCYHKVIDIQGDTEVSFMVPYCNNLIASSESAPNEFDVYFKVLAWSQPDATASTPIYLNVYKAGGSDMKFGGPREVGFQTQSNPRKDFAVEFDPLHEQMTGYKTDGLIYGEQFNSLRELAHRYHAYGVISSNTANKTYNDGFNTPACYLGIEMYGLLYKFWRGSINLRLLQRDQKFGMVRAVLTDGTRYEAVAFSNPNMPSIDANIPYYYGTLFRQQRHVTNEPIRYTMSYKAGDLPRFLMKSAGDDFSYHFLSAIPLGTFVDPPTGLGEVALQTWMET
jgi:hypothetical protein